MQRCKHLKTNGYDVICTLNGSTLGDIMGYDGRRCDTCINRQNVKGRKGWQGMNFITCFVVGV